jgi:hypothetical protein
MAIQREEHPFVRCTENIAMLYFLHQVPARPSSNPEPKDVSVETEYTLPFKEERNLSGILAFLAQTEDDPDHIPAVCLQETPEERSLNILLAVNGRGHPDHTSQGLSKTEVGFKKIASVLEHVDGNIPAPQFKVRFLIAPHR